MDKIIQSVFDEALKLHQMWLSNSNTGKRMDFQEKDLSEIKILRSADLRSADLRSADLRSADLRYADLRYANLRYADLRYANLRYANLRSADLRSANLSSADLSSADLRSAVGLIKTMGVVPGNLYYKRFAENMMSNQYYFRAGRNDLRDGEVFAADERETCSCPGFHFASKSWCTLHYDQRPLECLIKIPKDAEVNEPWATDGKASASAIIIVKIIDTRTGKDITRKFKNAADGFGNKIEKEE